MDIFGTTIFSTWESKKTGVRTKVAAIKHSCPDSYSCVCKVVCWEECTVGADEFEGYDVEVSQTDFDGNERYMENFCRPDVKGLTKFQWLICIGACSLMSAMIRSDDERLGPLMMLRVRKMWECYEHLEETVMLTNPSTENAWWWRWWCWWLWWKWWWWWFMGHVTKGTRSDDSRVRRIAEQVCCGTHMLKIKQRRST